VRIEHLENPIRCGNRLLQVGIHAAEFLGWRVHHQQSGEKRGELTGRQAP
jgi:hypothetical protein